MEGSNMTEKQDIVDRPDILFQQAINDLREAIESYENTNAFVWVPDLRLLLTDWERLRERIKTLEADKAAPIVEVLKELYKELDVSPQSICLIAGELSAQEMRTAIAIVNWACRKIRARAALAAQEGK